MLLKQFHSSSRAEIVCNYIISTIIKTMVLNLKRYYNFYECFVKYKNVKNTRFTIPLLFFI